MIFSDFPWLCGCLPEGTSTTSSLAMYGKMMSKQRRNRLFGRCQRFTVVIYAFAGNALVVGAKIRLLSLICLVQLNRNW